MRSSTREVDRAKLLGRAADAREVRTDVRTSSRDNSAFAGTF
jgi:hypothetical protein